MFVLIKVETVLTYGAIRTVSGNSSHKAFPLLDTNVLNIIFFYKSYNLLTSLNFLYTLLTN